ncbi:hypothetical protein TNCV_3967701 [Trichonephila clavipes]|uniref:Uncharacterized protein n=1 Tax=Trichonephila inaurata madagascariensis TaxID=2747483 RepID=A0A8X7BSD2_9ARAC|nr:hypothetical protein TNCV_3967701 [Trichonephila clavipes]GFY41493.1 hypothetical protein TNIN_212621 [Trichonephila inaurata madagascariensis]
MARGNEREGCQKKFKQGAPALNIQNEKEEKKVGVAVRGQRRRKSEHAPPVKWSGLGFYPTMAGWKGKKDGIFVTSPLGVPGASTIVEVEPGLLRR